MEKQNIKKSSEYISCFLNKVKKNMTAQLKNRVAISISRTDRKRFRKRSHKKVFTKSIVTISILLFILL